MSAVVSVRAAAPAPTLALNGVHVRFGGVSALNDVSLAIPPGPGISAIIGPNGAGKTTLFNVLTGIVPPTEGRVRIAGEDVTGRRPDEIFRARVSRTFQGVRLFAHLSVLQNVVLAARSVRHGGNWLRGAAEAEDRAKACLEAAGVDARLWSLWPDRLTLLEQRLVEIARALTVAPLVMLLDEPAAGLNTAEKQRLCALLEKLAASADCRVVVVEHDMKLVMSIAERIWVMNFGRLLAEGTPEQIRADPAVIEAYLGAQVHHD
jgi:ABC-type branched-subunit amino acid transport system ATPase component